jgi:hypothetical protein
MEVEGRKKERRKEEEREREKDYKMLNLKKKG